MIKYVVRYRKWIDLAINITLCMIANNWITRVLKESPDIWNLVAEDLTKKNWLYITMMSLGVILIDVAICMSTYFLFNYIMMVIKDVKNVNE